MPAAGFPVTGAHWHFLFESLAYMLAFGSVGDGIGRGLLYLGLLLGACQVIGTVLHLGLIWGALAVIGIAQVVVILPAYFLARQNDQTETAKGLLIIAGIIFFECYLLGFGGGWNRVFPAAETWVVFVSVAWRNFIKRSTKG